MTRQTGLVWLLLLFCTAVRASNLRQISSREGISNNAILSLAQDKHGFIWVGSCDGLNMWDGERMRLFPNDWGGETPLSGNLIEEIAVTTDSLFWIRTNYGLDLFDPDSTMPRDEFLAMCTHLTGTETLQGVLSTGFGDDEQIPAWAKTYVATAVMNGDIDGCSDGTAIVFDAQRGITAAEAAVMLSNFLDPSPAAALESAYIPDWACTAVSSLTSCGVYPDGSDCAAPITRAEAAQMLLGAYELLQKR